MRVALVFALSALLFAAALARQSDPPEHSPSDGSRGSPPGQHPPGLKPQERVESPPDKSPSDGSRGGTNSPPGQHPPGHKPQDIGNVSGKGTETAPPPGGQTGTVPRGQLPQRPQNIDDPPGQFPTGQDNGNKGVPGQHPPKHQPMSNPDAPEHSPSDDARGTAPGQHPRGLKPLDRLKHALGLKF